MKLLNFGSLGIDHVYRVPHFVKPGETLATVSYAKHCGGKGLNQSIAMARAGISVYHAGAVGADGGFLLDLLAGEGVDTRFIRQKAGLTGHAVIQVDDCGQNCILLHGGANHMVSTEQIKETLGCFSTGDWLVLQNEINALGEIASLAAAKGMRVVWNPSPVGPALEAMPRHAVFMLVLNEVEAEAISFEKEPTRQIIALRHAFPAAEIVLTLGEKGALVYAAEAKDVISQPAFPARAVDTTGAGDTFLGYYVAQRFQGNPPEDAAGVAAYAAAKAVEAPGAAGSIPMLTDLCHMKQHCGPFPAKSEA